MMIFASTASAKELRTLDFEVVKKEASASATAQKSAPKNADSASPAPDSASDSTPNSKPNSALDSARESTANAAPTLLLIGGIQGDEPGGFNATNVFLNHYTIKNGSVWVVPVLNPHSMLKNHRGIYDDMNRKFAALSPNDPEAPIIANIKELIRAKEVSAVLHLHDGSGYYRATYESALLNPNRWGNCTVIDQTMLEGAEFGALEKHAQNIIDHINAHLLKPIHRYHLHNTQTAQKDPEMQKALTFYAINQGKAAYANEASKELNVAERVYYHLLAIESMLSQMGIAFERDFGLTPKGVQAAINDPKQRFSIEGMPSFPLFGLRALQASFPLPKGKDYGTIRIESDNKILGLLPRENLLVLKYGNRVMSKFAPNFIEFGAPLAPINARIDGKEARVAMGEVVRVAQRIELESIAPQTTQNTIENTIAPNSAPATETITKSVRAKVVGLTKQNPSAISKAALNPNASIDVGGNLYRVEFYTRTQITQTFPREPLESPKKDGVKDEAESSAESKNVDSGKSLDSKVDSSAESSSDSNGAQTSQTTQNPQTAQTVQNTSSIANILANNPQAKPARVIASTAHVRAAPSVDSGIVAKAPLGRELFILGFEDSSMGAWAKIAYDFKGRDIQGYILARLLKEMSAADSKRFIASALESKNAESSAESSSTQTTQNPQIAQNTSSIANILANNPQAKPARVIASTAHVRAAPSVDSGIVAKAPLGRELFILGFEDSSMGAWAKIAYDFKGRDIQGYILARLLRLSADSAKASAQSGKTATKAPLKPIIKTSAKEEFSGMILLDFTPESK
ncbi:hypothetical protein BKN38_03745 [Helicobacter sp. CLO-3]|nr:hypothetical protein BA723_06280 [Helicobacter sp. CLO-3]OHU84149.1 hypothetical protein BKN38_03745 [Helicobacter sp. CLO-3]